MKRILFFVSSLLVLSTTAIAGDVIHAKGSSTVGPIVKSAAKAFQQETGIKVEVKGGGSSVGVWSAKDGSADIGLVSRALKTDESEDLKAHLIGMDGIAVIVNSKNPIKAITKQQVIDIYTGRVTNWKELGGPDSPIILESKAEGRSTRELFDKYFGLKGKVASSAHVIGSNAEAITFVSRTPSAIGYVSVGTAEGASRKGVAITLLELDGARATSVNVANGKYPLCRELNLVTKGESTGKVQKFLEFMGSRKGQLVVAKQGFVPVR